ncbi:hypothetical protein Dimus_022308 [Dionaea muscipula]
MAYVISVPHHKLPYGELLTRVFRVFQVTLYDKEGDQPVKTEFYEEIFLNICQLRRENDIWWIGTGANRRRDDEEVAAKQDEKEAEDENFGSGEKYFDAMDDVEDLVDVTAPGSDVIATAPVIPEVSALALDQQKGKIAAGDDPSGPSGSMLDFDLLHLQAEFARALQRNTLF